MTSVVQTTNRTGLVLNHEISFKNYLSHRIWLGLYLLILKLRNSKPKMNKYFSSLDKKRLRRIEQGYTVYDLFSIF